MLMFWEMKLAFIGFDFILFPSIFMREYRYFAHQNSWFW
ncbi:hypothetical protein TSIB_1174 [Thermococcus sibiricus MM 739]|uniref:Uncharacterized protein n=1 Tax=Thermococcus sibiricus (strain DSM 12597 / MM 739) TaxID=604354 RepID=C6A3N3_THESM|nr:hypothetical protein TSIB_1174 [Thermococcus sibiricus MM 739]